MFVYITGPLMLMLQIFSVYTATNDSLKCFLVTVLSNMKGSSNVSDTNPNQIWSAHSNSLPIMLFRVFLKAKRTTKGDHYSAACIIADIHSLHWRHF